MAQEWDEDEENYRQEMEKVIDLLEECNIDFKVEGDKILIKGDVEYAEIFSLPAITIVQGDNLIGFDKLWGFNKITVNTPTGVKEVELPQGVYANYQYPYLIIHF
jgi:hypothetical protein